MTHVLTIAAREIRERTFVLWTAAGVAVLPFFARFLPGTRLVRPDEVTQTTAAVLAMVLMLGLALLLGSTFVSRELKDGRLSFYFSKPISTHSLWLGKLLGAMVLTTLVFAIIVTPAALVSPGVVSSMSETSPVAVVAGLMGISLVLILLAHAASTMFRARSAMLIADLILLAVCGVAAWRLVQSFAAEGFFGVVMVIAAVLASTTMAALLGAGAWQLSRGRTDVRRSHMEMSKFLWTAVVAGLLLGGIYAIWVRSAGVEDLTQMRAVQNSNGRFALLAGPAKWRSGYAPLFIANLKTGESNRFPVAAYSDTNFTTNGKALFGISHPVGERSGHLVVQRLGDRGTPVIMPVAVDRSSAVVLSDDISRAAVRKNALVSVYRIDDGRLLASARIPDMGSSRLFSFFFPQPDQLRILLVTGQPRTPLEELASHTLRVFELDIPTRRLTKTGEWQTEARNLWVSASADGNRLIVNRLGGSTGPKVQILDGKSAAPLQMLPNAAGWSFQGVSALGDGRFVNVPREARGTLSVSSADGMTHRTIPIGVPGLKWGYVNGEAGPGTIVITLRNSQPWNEKRAGRGYHALVVDIEKGTVIRREANVFISPRWGWRDPRAETPNTTGDYLLTDAEGRVWQWNALTGARKKIAG